MQLPETLGEIDQLFCDKTGTLTQNDLSFRSISLQGKRFEGMTKEEILEKFYAVEGNDREELDKSMEMFILCFCVCNDITLVEQEDGSIVFNGESQEEHLLLEFTKAAKTYELKKRSLDTIVLYNKSDKTEKEYGIVRNIKFTTTRR